MGRELRVGAPISPRRYFSACFEFLVFGGQVESAADSESACRDNRRRQHTNRAAEDIDGVLNQGLIDLDLLRRPIRRRGSGLGQRLASADGNQGETRWSHRLPQV
jgi:hypothetical protein